MSETELAIDPAIEAQSSHLTQTGDACKENAQNPFYTCLPLAPVK